MTREHWAFIALLVGLAVVGVFALTIPANRSRAIENTLASQNDTIAALWKELDSVRDSLRVERDRADVLEMAKADRVFSTPHLWTPRQVTIIGAADSQGIARAIRVDRLGRVVVSP